MMSSWIGWLVGCAIHFENIVSFVYLIVCIYMLTLRLQALISIRIPIVAACHSTLLINWTATSAHVLVQLNNVRQLGSTGCSMRNQSYFSINACLLFRQEGWVHVLGNLFLCMRGTCKNMGLRPVQISWFGCLLKSWMAAYGCDIYTVSLLEILRSCWFLICNLNKRWPFFGLRHIHILPLLLTQPWVCRLQHYCPGCNIPTRCPLHTSDSNHVIVTLLAAISSHLKHMHHLHVIDVLIRTSNSCTF